MIAQLYFPRSLSASRLDTHLASGWFRSCNYLHKFKIICIEAEVSSVVNIRLDLNNYIPPKRMRKIKNRVERNFITRVRPAIITQEKEALYHNHKARFKGHVFESLQHIIYEDPNRPIFDTYEVSVYDGNKLIAFSFFDLGNTSVASIIGIFDENYSSYSLGTYTMLAEAVYGQHISKRFYYPGYILTKNHSFDYKLKIGEMMFYDGGGSGRWKNFASLDETLLPDYQLSKTYEKLSEYLKINNIPFKQHHYDFFALGFMPPFKEELFKNVMYVTIDEADSRKCVIEYDFDTKSYRLCYLKEAAEYAFLLSSGYDSSQPLLKYQHFLLESEDLITFGRMLKEFLRTTPKLGKQNNTNIK